MTSPTERVTPSDVPIPPVLAKAAASGSRKRRVTNGEEQAGHWHNEPCAGDGKSRFSDMKTPMPATRYARQQPRKRPRQCFGTRTKLDARGRVPDLFPRSAMRTANHQRLNMVPNIHGSYISQGTLYGPRLGPGIRAPYPRRMSDSSLARKIRDLRHALGKEGKPLPGEVFAELVGTTQATVSRWEQDKARPKDDYLLALARLANQSLPEFLYGRDLGVPLISWVSAGRLTEAQQIDELLTDDVERIAVSGLGSGDYFALRVDGDSVNRIAPDGSIIIVDRTDRELFDKRFYVFAIGGEATFKRYRANPDRLEPYSYNPEHETIFPTEDMRVVGRIIKAIVDDL